MPTYIKGQLSGKLSLLAPILSPIRCARKNKVIRRATMLSATVLV